MRLVQICVAYLGRLFLSVIFLFSALTEIIDWTNTNQMLLSTYTRWMHLYQAQQELGLIGASLLPWLGAFLGVALALKIIGSLLLILGWNVRFGAFCLILFIVPVTIVMHDFWNQVGSDQSLEMVMFLKNLAIFGGLMIVLAFGKGPKKDELSGSE